MDIAADSAAALAMTPEMEMHFHQLVAEAGALFGSRHYRDYHFLLTLSDDVAHFGLEHHESSDDRTSANSLTDEAGRNDFADLLPHEFVHSWNGKYRRPADLATPDYQQPMKDDLLWVYEGYGISGRSAHGAQRASNSRDCRARQLAYIAGDIRRPAGRDWRPLQDTADAAVFLYDAGADWSNWRRGTDFYDEGRAAVARRGRDDAPLTNDKKSINDFCRAFHGGPGGEPALKTYTFEDIVARPQRRRALRLGGLPAHAARFDGARHAARSGAKCRMENRLQRAAERRSKRIRDRAKAAGPEFFDRHAIGDDGSVDDVIHDGPSYKAGIGPGMKITAVNGHQFTAEGLKDAIDAAKSTSDADRADDRKRRASANVLGRLSRRAALSASRAQQRRARLPERDRSATDALEASDQEREGRSRSEPSFDGTDWRAAK